MTKIIARFITFLSFTVLCLVFCLAATTPATTPDSTLVPSSTFTQTNTQTNYPEFTSNPPSVSGERYDQLSVCPTVPTNCPDINGTGGNATTCPDYCTVTRSPSSLTVSGANHVAGSIKDAICPPSYTTVGVYNMQNEGTYNPSPATIAPINGMNAFISYINAGYSCTIYGSIQTSNEYCSQQYSDGQYTDQINNATPNVVRINSSANTSCYWTSLGCSVTCNCSMGGASQRWTYYYYRVQCTPPAGVFLTGNLAPVSIVCARGKTKWVPLQ